MTSEVRVQIREWLQLYAEQQLMSADDQRVLTTITERAARNSFKQATKLAPRCLKLIQFQQLRGAPVTEAEILSPATIGDFAREAGKMFDLALATVNTYVGDLWKLYDHAPFALPPGESRAQAGATTHKGSGPPAILSMASIRNLFVAAKAQRRPTARDAALAMLLLGLGAGVPPPLLKLARGIQVAEWLSNVQVCIPTPTGTRVLWVLRRYQPELLSVAGRAGSRLLLGGYANQINVTGNLTWRIDLGQDVNIRLLNATYQHELAKVFELKTLADQLGHTSLNTMGRHTKVLPSADPETAARLLCGTDESRGPWSPDWPSGAQI